MCLRALIASRNENEKQQKYREIVCFPFFHHIVVCERVVQHWYDMAADSKRWPNWIRIKTDFHDNMQTCDLASVETWRDFFAIAEEKKKKEQQQAKHDEEETSIKADEFCYFWCADDRFNLCLCRHLTHNYTTSQKQLTYDSRSALLNHECVLPKRERIQRLRNFLFRRRAADWSSYLSVGLTDGFDGKNDDHTLEY